MKSLKIFTTLIIVIMTTLVVFTSCTKENPAKPDIVSNFEKYDVHDPVVAEPTREKVIAAIDSCNLWPHDVTSNILANPHMSVEEKYTILQSYLPRNTSEDGGLETIARKFDGTGNANSNGSNAYWDCSPDLLALTIAQLGTSCDERAINNFYNAANSTTSITLSDVLRAANGVNNQSFNSTIELLDLVFEYEVSGGNWIVGAVILYDGQEYLFSELTGDEGGLIYDPQNGGTFLLGPMPGGIVSLNITGLYEPPIE